MAQLSPRVSREISEKSIYVVPSRRGKIRSLSKTSRSRFSCVLNYRFSFLCTSSVSKHSRRGSCDDSEEFHFTHDSRRLDAFASLLECEILIVSPERLIMQLFRHFASRSCHEFNLIKMNLWAAQRASDKILLINFMQPQCIHKSSH